SPASENKPPPSTAEPASVAASENVAALVRVWQYSQSAQPGPKPPKVLPKVGPSSPPMPQQRSHETRTSRVPSVTQPSKRLVNDRPNRQHRQRNRREHQDADDPLLPIGDPGERADSEPTDQLDPDPARKRAQFHHN